MALSRADLIQATLRAITTHQTAYSGGDAYTKPIYAIPRLTSPEPPVVTSYLTFYSPDGEFTLNVYDNAKHWDGILEWSTDTVTWTEWPGTTTLSSSGGYLYMRGSGNTRIIGEGRSTYRWIINGQHIECSGNVETLLDYSIVTAGGHPIMANYCYYHMFYGCTGLTTAPELPATTLTSYCYGGMFNACTGLTAAPELPATTLADHCYHGMFFGCISLTTAPELPATTLADHCYRDMFNDCANLTIAPELPATTLAQHCYDSMFYGCTGLTAAPELPATTLAQFCYDSMFYGCTGLTTAPELPATTLASYCYAGMFSDCTSLTTAPELPATTLADYCYRTMFNNCRSLRISATSDATYAHPYRIPTSGTGTTASGALMSMFTGTGGPFTGPTSINTTYYTDHEPV